MIVPVLSAACLTVKSGVWCHIDLTPQNRIDPSCFRLPVKIDDAIHHSVVRDGCAVHAKLLHPGYIFFYFVGTVQQAVLCMDMQMCKIHAILLLAFRFRLLYHLCYFIQVRHRRTCREARAPKELSSARLCDPPEARLSAGDCHPLLKVVQFYKHTVKQCLLEETYQNLY